MVSSVLQENGDAIKNKKKKQAAEDDEEEVLTNGVEETTPSKKKKKRKIEAVEVEPEEVEADKKKKKRKRGGMRMNKLIPSRWTFSTVQFYCFNYKCWTRGQAVCEQSARKAMP